MPASATLSASLASWRPRLRIGGSLVAVADQVLISGTNFLTMVLVARSVSVLEFGAFTLVYSLLLGMNSVQSGLVTQPHNILAVTRRGGDYRRYTASTAVSQLALGTASALLAALAAGGFALAGWSGAALLLLMLAPAVFGWQLHEYFRRVLYTEGRLVTALSVDALAFGGQSLLIASLWSQQRLSGPAALAVIAVCSTTAAVAGLWQIRGSLTRALDLGVWKENWHFGKWLVGGNLVGQWLSSDLFIVLSAALLTTAAAGVLRAVDTLFGPLRLLQQVMMTVLPIRFAKRLANEGARALDRDVRQIGVVVVPLLFAYCLAAALLAGPLLQIVFGDQYRGYSGVLALVALETFLAYVAMIVAAVLRAQRRTREVFTGRLWASLIALPIGVAAIPLLGIYGAVVGMIATQVALLAIFWFAYQRALQNEIAAEQDRAAVEQKTGDVVGGVAATGDAAVGEEPFAGPPGVPSDVSERPSHLEERDRGAAEEPAVAGAHALETQAVEPSQAVAKGRLLQQVLEALDRQQIPYCITHGYQEYPQRVDSDVDCIMPPAVLPDRLAEVLSSLPAAAGAGARPRLVGWQAGGAHGIVLEQRRGRNASSQEEDLEPLREPPRSEPTSTFLSLDVSRDYDLNKRFFCFSGKRLLASRQRHPRGFWVPAVELEFAGYLVRRVAKRQLEPVHGERLAELYRQAPQRCREALAEIWPRSSVTLLAAAAERGDWNEVQAQLPRLRHQLLRSSARRHPARIVANWLSGGLRLLKRWLRPTAGLHVLLLGPDGAGKSSLIERLQADLQGLFPRSSCWSFPPRLLKLQPGVPGQPHAQPPRSWAASLTRAVLYWGTYYGPGYWFTVRPALVRGELVFHDRHLIDALVDPRRYRYGGPKWLLRALWRLVPQPDLILVLDAPAEVLQQRKQEVPFEETARQRTAYQQLAIEMPRARVLRVDTTLEETAAVATEWIVQSLTDRTAQRLQLRSPAADEPQPAEFHLEGATAR